MGCPTEINFCKINRDYYDLLSIELFLISAKFSNFSNFSNFKFDFSPCDLGPQKKHFYFFPENPIQPIFYG